MSTTTKGSAMECDNCQAEVEVNVMTGTPELVHARTGSPECRHDGETACNAGCMAEVGA